MNESLSTQDRMTAGAVLRPSVDLGSIPAPKITYAMRCLDKDGNLKWSETFENLVTTAGKTDIVDKYLKGSSYTAAWYLGLKGSGSANAADTLASHAGWTEITAYTGNRAAITWGTTASGSNTATTVSFAITGTATVAGAFTSTVATGTSGILYSAGDFAVARGWQILTRSK